MKKLLTFLTLLTLFFTTALAGSKTFSLTGGSGAFAGMTDSPIRIYTQNGVTAGTLYTESLRIYNNGEFIVTTTETGVKITQIDFTFSTGKTFTLQSGGGTWSSPTWTSSSGSSEVVFVNKNGTGSSNQVRVTSVTVTYTSGDTPQPTTYNVNIGSMTNGSVSASSTSGIAEGDPVTLTISPSNGYELETLTIDNVDVTSSVSNNQYTFNMPGHDVDVDATFQVEQTSGNTQWVLTDPSALRTNDIVLIVDKYSARAMSNNNGTDSAPSATTVVLNSEKTLVTSGANDNLQWTVTNTNGTYNFAVPGTSNYLYATNTNNGVRVGTGSAKDFVMTDNGSGVEYLTCTGTTDTRYLGVYNDQDWRCYTGMGGNIASTVVGFYKKNDGSTPQPSVATPVISGETPFDETTTVTITCDTEGSTVYYTTDGTDPDNNSAEYSTPFPLNASATVKAIAYVGETASQVATKEFVKNPSAATVAEILQLGNNTTFKFTGELVVSAVYSTSNIYAQDETGGILIYTSNLPYEKGDIIPSGFIAKRTSYGDAPELTNMTGYAEATETSELVATEVGISQIGIGEEQLPYLFKYSVIKNATVTSSTITVGNESVSIFNRFNVTLPSDGKAYDVYGITSYHSNNGAQFIPLDYEETYIDPGEGYYLVGNFSGWKRYENYKFTEVEGSLVLNNVTLPDNAEFKIVNKTSSSEIWYGGQTDNTDQANLYVLHGGWHTDIPLTNSENNNYVKNFSIAAGGVTSFTFNTSTMKFDALRAAQVYFTCDKINNWAKAAMTATDNGWTITKELEAGAKFAFIDEWGGHHGNDWVIKPEHYGDNYDILLGNANTPTMQDAGYYKIDVNRDLSVMHVNKEFAINCSAYPNGGGNVTAKVGGVTVESAMSGETVTIEYTTANGYTFNNITLNGNALEAVDGVYSFTMPNADANVVANFTAQSFAITVVSENGTTTCPATATTSSTVTFTVTPETDYEVISVTASFVNGENTTNVPVTYDEENDEYSFNMPPFPVTVKVNYKAPFVSKMYKKITSIGEIDEDLTYIVVGYRNSNTTDYVMGFIGEETYAGTVIATPDENGLISSTEEMAIVTLGENSGKYSFLTDEGYLNNSSNGKNRINAGDSPVYLNVSFGEEGVISITQDVNTYKTFTFNASSPRFAFYQNVQNGGSLYLYKEVVEEITLAGLVELGAAANDKKYCINEDLLGVKKSADGKTIWFKDDNKFANPDVCNSSDNNFEMSANGEVWYSKDATFDQSNWIEVVFPEAVNYDENYAKNLTGVYSYNNGNPKLTITTTDGIEETLYEGTISTNKYMPANFVGTQEGHYTNNGTVVTCNYFFVTPKPQEVARIFYAVYSNGTLTMPENQNGVSGTVSVDMSKNSGTGTGLVDGNVYSDFDVIICKETTTASPRLKAQGDSYKVYPLNLSSDKVTAISTVGVNGEVKSVKYVSVAGVVSDRPFQGVNIVVTEYTDGTRTTAKVVK